MSIPARVTPGTMLGPYEVSCLIGAGGMGQVWKARDTRLDRLVAIKVADGRFSERFEREARAIAALNHPHICALHDIGPDYLVMEYIEGTPLEGPFPVSKVIELGMQIADALDAAHRAGIVHRDLKPANILVTRNGIKLLDFGLAKKHSQAAAADGLTATITSEGAIIGTLKYMAPEQVEGREADARTDIFALGCVMYEMVTGRRAFDGKTSASVIAAILEREPAAISEVQPVAPAALDHVIRTCLRKDPEQRWQSAHDVKLELEWVANVVPPPALAAPGRRWPWIAALSFLFLIAAGALVALFSSRAANSPIIRFAVPPPDGSTYETLNFLNGGFALSSDGTMLASVVRVNRKPMLCVRSLASVEQRILPGTEAASLPFWSPDGRYIGFQAANQLMRVSVSGGAPEKIAAPFYHGPAAWAADGTILASSIGRLIRVTPQGDVASMVFPHIRSDQLIAEPIFLPDGQTFLYNVSDRADGSVSSVYVGRLSAKPEEQPKEPLVTKAAVVGFVPARKSTPLNSTSGFLVVVQDNALQARSFNSGSLKVGSATLRMERTINRTGISAISLSDSGVVAYINIGPPRHTLKWLDRTGRQTGSVGPEAEYYNPGFSADGRQLLIAKVDSATRENQDAMSLDLLRNVETRLTFFPKWDGVPVFAPDGQRFAFGSAREELTGMYVQRSDGTAEADRIVPEGKRPEFPQDWSSDGRWLLYQAGDGSNFDLGIVSGEERHWLRNTQFSERHGQFMPGSDGKTWWIAFDSNESGSAEIYVQNFEYLDGKVNPSVKLKVSNGGGTQPRWDRTGRYLFYLSEQKLMSVTVRKTPAGLDLSPPSQMFDYPRMQQARFAFNYAVHPDGQRFLFVADSTEAGHQVIVMLNWLSGLL